MVQGGDERREGRDDGGVSGDAASEALEVVAIALAVAAVAVGAAMMMAAAGRRLGDGGTEHGVNEESALAAMATTTTVMKEAEKEVAVMSAGWKTACRSTQALDNSPAGCSKMKGSLGVDRELARLAALSGQARSRAGQQSTI